jgi:hypothetical protein
MNVTLYNSSYGHGGILIDGTELVWDLHNGQIHLTEHGKVLGVFETFTQLKAHLARKAKP